MLAKGRIKSVDIFRGLTIVLMILVNTPGTWSNVYAPFLHAKWHGYTPTDLVFPFFLFIVGTSIAFAYQKKKGSAEVIKKITIRALKLIGLGLFLGAFTISFPFFKDFSEIRFPGVLQRIGVVFFIVSILYLYTNRKTLVLISISLLVGYWLLVTFVPVNGIASTLERAPNNLVNFLDVKVFGTHNYMPDYDPEGLLSTIPSLVTSFLGIFTGLILISKQEKKTTLLVGIGGSMLIIGSIWGIFFPINKAMWTSSFVLVTAGWANLVLALIYYVTDIKGIQFGSLFRYTGANAITVYFLSSFISKIMGSIMVTQELSVHGWLYQNIFVNKFISLEASSLLYALTVVWFYITLAYILYHKKIFIKV
ncbi:heparan-alpha-glucosaminide N-acetyltransferase domain-containing protein [uncultured Maribacter sp.]|uniref:acyltransferase family protein n=1 Tax=uncultured Maribacter sp. TaxID=431308 RepID=UPI00260D74E5|nr:heparan-alpha-glucosaminide N-acetyltransferase domain-containing protein [uncultured Maribacter sp.]